MIDNVNSPFLVHSMTLQGAACSCEALLTTLPDSVQQSRTSRRSLPCPQTDGEYGSDAPDYKATVIILSLSALN